MRIKKGDNVIVVAGKDKGATGQVLKTFASKERVLVEGINMMKKHVRASQFNPDGGVVEQEAPIHVSNVMLVDPKTKKPTKVGYKFDENGKKVRYAKDSGQAL